jgi:tripartite-type tricarboxylate transporter receptor subunit TctC
MKTWRSAFFTAAIALLFAHPGRADTPFYAGKTIDIIVPYSPGGYYDIGARLIARYLGDKIPGKPRVIVESQPSAGGIGLAQRFAAGQDNNGTVLGVLQRSVPQYAIVGYQTAAFDPTKLTWIGSVSSYKGDAYTLFLNAHSPVKTIKDLQETRTPVRIGAGRAGSANLIYALIAKQALGLKLDIVRGYAGSAPLFLAEQSHEVDGFFADLSDVKVGLAQQWRDREINPIVQFGRTKRLADLPRTPTADELITSGPQRDLLEFSEYPFGIALPLAGPAGMPKDRAEILRRAFNDMAADPRFLADAQRIHFECSPVSGKSVEKNVEASVKASAAVKKQFKTLISQ